MTEAVGPLEPGKVVAGRYRIDATLGRGGMGVVYRATDQRLGREVALKAIGRAAGASEGARRRLEAEARAVAALDHPGIVTLYDVLEQGDEIFLVMELVSGRSLRAILDEGPLSAERVGAIVVALADALGAAHARGFVHRDVKPDNVMVRPDERVALLDFGIAKVAVVEPGSVAGTDPTATAEGLVVGTPAYLTPEQARAEEVGAATDQFALAVTAHELLTRKLPWRTTTSALLLADIVHAEPLLYLSPWPALESVLRRALSKSRDARYPDVRAFASAFAEAVRGSASDSAAVDPYAATLGFEAAKDDRPSTKSGAAARTADPTRRSGGRRRVLAASVVGVGLALAVVLAFAGRALWKTRGGHDVPSASPSTSSSHALSSVPAAQFEFERGLDGLRHRSMNMALLRLVKAIELDPGFASAHAWLAIWSLSGGPQFAGRDIEDARRHFAEAKRGSARLDPRERALLDAYEPLTRVTPDRSAFRLAMEKISAEYPDADVQFLLAGAEFLDGRRPQSSAALRRVLELDRTYGPAYSALASWAFEAGDAAEGEAQLARCITLAPATGMCNLIRAMRLAHSGQCAELERAGRDWQVADPEYDGGNWQVAHAMFAQGKPIAAVRAALEAGSAEALARAESLAGAQLAIADGDFDAAIAALVTARSAAHDAANRSAATYYLVEAYVETGRLAEAEAAARKQVLERGAFAEVPTISAFDDAQLLHVLRVAKKATPADAVAARALLTSKLEAAPPMAWWEGDPKESHLGFLYDHHPLFVDEARELLDAAKGAELPNLAELLAAAYIETGQPEAALAVLRAPGRPCRDFDFVFGWVREHLWLGIALEHAGDLAGARSEYQRLLDHWGQAKPRSRTADEARARLAKLPP